MYPSDGANVSYWGPPKAGPASGSCLQLWINDDRDFAMAKVADSEGGDCRDNDNAVICQREMKGEDVGSPQVVEAAGSDGKTISIVIH